MKDQSHVDWYRVNNSLRKLEREHHKCPTCDGNGWFILLKGTKPIVCERCKGTGWIDKPISSEVMR